MMNRSVWKFLARGGLSALLFAALPATIVSAQSVMAGGMGGQPATSQMPLKVVIMLGNDYDFAQPPFVDASDVLSYFDNLDPLNPLQFSPPVFDTIDVDVETAIPSDRHKIVVAVMPQDLDETDQKKFKRKVQLIALRFGINHVETIEKKPDAEEISYPETIWLRVPFWNSEDMSAEAGNYGNVAVALSNALDDGFSHQPRLDIYEIPYDPSDDPFGGGGADPFGSGGGDPFGGGDPKQSSDPFDAPAPTTDEFDPFGAGSPPKLTDDQIKMQIDRSKRLIEQLRQKAKASIKSEASAEQIRKIISMYVAADYHTHTEIQKLEFRALESKLDKIRQDIQKRESESVKKAIIEERVRRMLESRNQ
ncbi:hypothetical protein [Allorhodopirellula heiligendammensis]|uniref:Uncharacterized protein n=1 Tax=Allorhodopirellula heiligendammensis TaxID=2714739 RepID=A0A5C6C076_9BACT|nr:hypothetical protein [Allorhodopirellula heiligendammensis]TWU17041.1 hypothetical protein Poly21_42500 [Allorhodopirellula heiligendammensis]